MHNYALLAFIVLLTVVADYALKHASLKISPFVSGWFVAGVLLYAFTAIGWLALMRTYDLAQIAVLYSSSTIIALTALGIVYFDETLSLKQFLGISAAVLSVFLMEADA